VRRIEVTERERPVFGGKEFGAVGPYERLHGTSVPTKRSPPRAIGEVVTDL
jgi:hypothetical protein